MLNFTKILNNLGSKNKLKRFRENETFSNVLQPTREQVISNGLNLKGNWNTAIFKNNNPITLELGCGKGEYSVGLAREHPDRNFIGIDIKGARFWRGAKTALDQQLKNVFFIRTQIELVDYLFAQNEVAQIWITFPDPQIKYKRTKHRMTNPEFLAKYKVILGDPGFLHLKTDSEFMHGYTLGLLEGLQADILYAHHDVYKNDYSPLEATGIKTYYEQQYLDQGKKITYLKCRLP